MSETPPASDLPDLQLQWDYNDPEATEQRLRALLPIAEAAGNSQYLAELKTQIARSLSLRRLFEEAHALLDEIDATLTTGSMPRACVRLLLERGRTLNSSGDREGAMPHFNDAWETAREHSLDELAVDAAHMMAIVCDGDDAITWNECGLDLARRSTDPSAQRWIGSLLNNLGWTHHARGDFQEALQCFLWALDAREEEDDAASMRIARWCVARCLRSLGRTAESLAMQVELERQLTDAGERDGFVDEEIAECLHALGRTGEARAYFRSAYELLAADESLAAAEPERIERLRALGRST